MSIVLKDGTVLPDIPADVLENYPYVIIYYANSGATWRFICGVAKFGYLPLNIGSVVSGGQITSDVIATLGAAATYEYDANSNSWTKYATWTAATWINPDLVRLSNHDIEVVASVDTSTGEVVGSGTIYLPKNFASAPPFVLPDGTELPALPEGCFEKYPYGVIYCGYFADYDINLYSAYWTDVPLHMFASHVVSDGDGAAYDTLMPLNNPINYVSCQLSDDMSAWGEPYTRTDVTFEQIVDDYMLNGELSAVGSVAWSNHDILTATENDDGTTTPGTTLYRKSDVNYRIYGGWLNSMGNQARRLGNVSGALKPGEMETVFKGSEAPTLANWIGAAQIDENTGALESDTKTIYIPAGFFGLPSANFPKATEISLGAFVACSTLQEFTAPLLEVIGNATFMYCTSLAKVSLPGAVAIGPAAFGYCSALSEVDLSSAEEIHNNAFLNCTSLSEISLPKAKALAAMAFYNCTGLTKVDLDAAESLGAVLFYGCAKLDTVIIRSSKMCVLNKSDNTEGYGQQFPTGIAVSGTGYVYVPKALLETYRANAAWQSAMQYRDFLRAIEDYPDICGT